MECVIREATSEDCEHLMTLIKDSAVYHRVPNAAKLTPQILKTDGFGKETFYKCILAEMPADESRGQKARVVGHAMYFFGYSVMRGRMIYLENLHVMPEFRGKGIGRRLMCKVAEIGLDAGCIELRFLTMEWNAQGREFYTRLGAQDTTETKKFRSMEIGKEDLQKMDITAYHHLQDDVTINSQVLKADGFGKEPFYKCMLAEMPADESGGQKARPIGYALYFFGYGMKHGRMVYLENLYVVPEFRGKGIGRRLMSKVAEIAVATGCMEIKFVTMEWNSQAKAFYVRLGAHDTTESLQWHCMEFGGDALQRLAHDGKEP